LLDAIAGEMPGDPYSARPPERRFSDEVGADPGRLRIGLMTRTPAGSPACDPECAAAVTATGRLLESLGHDVSVAHPDAMDEHALLIAGFSTVIGCWTAKGLDHWGERVGRPITEADVEHGTWSIAARGREISAQQYLAAVDELQAWSRRMAAWWGSDFDLLVTPTIATPPPRIGELRETGADGRSPEEKIFGLISYTPQFNVTGQPALSLPLAWSASGLPIGLQFIAASAREDLLFRIASQLEQAQPWAGRRPAQWVSSPSAP
jgi:amidase